VEEVLPKLKEGFKGFTCYYSKTRSDLAGNVTAKLSEAINLDTEIKKCSEKPEPEEVTESILVTDPLIFIYTSGTTGLPKAVIIKHIR